MVSKHGLLWVFEGFTSVLTQMFCTFKLSFDAYVLALFGLETVLVIFRKIRWLFRIFWSPCSQCSVYTFYVYGFFPLIEHLKWQRFEVNRDEAIKADPPQKFSELTGCRYCRKMSLLVVLTTLAGLLTLGEGIKKCQFNCFSIKVERFGQGHQNLKYFCH